MHTTPTAWQSQPRVAPAPAPLTASFDVAAASPLAQADVFEPEQTLPDAPTSEPWIPEAGSYGRLGERASLWAVAQDFTRELASSIREAYATSGRDGFVEAIRMLTSHIAQLSVSTSAFFIFNLGRRLNALWLLTRGDP